MQEKQCCRTVWYATAAVAPACSFLETRTYAHIFPSVASLSVPMVGAAHEEAAVTAGICAAEAGDVGGRAIDVFEMERRIPPYLFALAVGDIAVKEISPRVNVYAGKRVPSH